MKPHGLSNIKCTEWNHCPRRNTIFCSECRWMTNNDTDRDYYFEGCGD